MDQERQRLVELQSKPDFHFSRGEDVEVCDRGGWWPAKVAKLEWDGDAQEYNYFCRFPGYNWNKVRNLHNILTIELCVWVECVIEISLDSIFYFTEIM